MKIFKAAFCIFLFFLVLFGGIYPLFVYGIGHLFFPDKAKGSLLINKEGQIVGSRLLGQQFQEAKYFHPRPSTRDYDTSHSSDSRLSQTSKKFLKNVYDNSLKYKEENELSATNEIPVDAVTSSASGLDPHISLQNAKLQVKRVAKERQMTEDALWKIVKEHTKGPTLGLFGTEHVNVVLLNLALDQDTSAAQRKP